jgi:cytochrome b
MPKPARDKLAVAPALGVGLAAPMARVWDPLVRFFHWSLVLSFAVAWLSANRIEMLHMWAGYAAGGLVAMRLVWGFVGTRHARFTDFVRHPATVLGYLRDILRGTESRHLGHNPAGGAMVIALLIGVAGMAVTGWMMYTDTYYGVDWVAQLHWLIAHAVLLLIFLHIGGVALASIRHRENLVRAMVTGAKRLTENEDAN